MEPCFLGAREKSSKRWAEGCWGLPFSGVTKRKSLSKTALPRSDHSRITPDAFSILWLLLIKQKKLITISAPERYVAGASISQSIKSHCPWKTRQDQAGTCAEKVLEALLGSRLASQGHPLSTTHPNPLVSPVPLAFTTQFLTFVSPIQSLFPWILASVAFPILLLSSLPLRHGQNFDSAF